MLLENIVKLRIRQYLLRFVNPNLLQIEPKQAMKSKSLASHDLMWSNNFDVTEGNLMPGETFSTLNSVDVETPRYLGPNDKKSLENQQN